MLFTELGCQVYDSVGHGVRTRCCLGRDAVLPQDLAIGRNKGTLDIGAAEVYAYRERQEPAMEDTEDTEGVGRPAAQALIGEDFK